MLDQTRPKNRIYNSQELKSLQVVNKEFKTKLSPYLAKLMQSSEAIKQQFMPSPQEAVDFEGQTRNPFEGGKNNQGIYGLERVYADRAVLTPYFECAAYCRYCFKKTRTLGGEPLKMNRHQIDQAMRFLASDSRINTLLVTGGDPFLDHDLLLYVLKQASQIAHIKNIRIGTRNILFRPDTITKELAKKLADFNFVEPYDLSQSRNISVAFSVNHIDELTPEVVQAIQNLTKEGITIRGQTVLLKGINDSTRDIQNIVNGFMAVGIIPYYLLHCMPVVGTSHMRTSVKKGIDILRELSVNSGTTAFNYVYVSPLGKHRVGSEQKLNYEYIKGQRYVVAQSPYKAQDFMEFTGATNLPHLHEELPNGRVLSRYLDGQD